MPSPIMGCRPACPDGGHDIFVANRQGRLKSAARNDIPAELTYRVRPVERRCAGQPGGQKSKAPAVTLALASNRESLRAMVNSPTGKSRLPPGQPVDNSETRPMSTGMVTISIPAEAYRVITGPAGPVRTRRRGRVSPHLNAKTLDRLTAARGPDESYSDVILRLARWNL